MISMLTLLDTEYIVWSDGRRAEDSGFTLGTDLNTSQCPAVYYKEGSLEIKTYDCHEHFGTLCMYNKEEGKDCTHDHGKLTFCMLY